MRKTLTAIALMLMTTVSAFAQITAVPQIMQFQGRLTKPDGTPVADGTYSVRFSLWTAQTGGTEKWNQTINPVTVRNGVFSTQLNTSTGAADKFNGNLFLEIKIGSNAPLTPRQPLASVAYAMKADSVKNNSITSASIADGTITSADLATGVLNNLSWLLNGNAGVTSGFLGTTDNKPLDLRVNNRRAMRYQYAENTTVPGQEYRSINMLGGSETNQIGDGVVGATIAGGGLDTFSLTDVFNQVLADFGTAGGGFGNSAKGFASTVAGGGMNLAQGTNSTVAGGQRNRAEEIYSFVGGGESNQAQGTSAVVAGGNYNIASGFASIAGGGYANRAQGTYSAIGGGGINNAQGGYTSIGGGYQNGAIGDSSTVAGGYENSTGDAFATVAGGYHNTASHYSATVGGGYKNQGSQSYATVGGGNNNRANGHLSTVGGGYNNEASGLAATIPGGYSNYAFGDYSFAAGYGAKATYRGSFVWADSQGGDFYSSGNDQFLVRAQGGVHLFGPTTMYTNTYVWAPFTCRSLYVQDLPLGDRRNVQWESSTGRFFYDSSSRKTKQNITPLKDDFFALLKAEPVTYTRATSPDFWEIGFIAEDFDALGLKKLVDYASDGKTPEGINYEKICLYLTVIAREQQKRQDTLQKDVDTLKTDNGELKKENTELKNRLGAIEQALAELKAQGK